MRRSGPRWLIPRGIPSARFGEGSGSSPPLTAENWLTAYHRLTQARGTDWNSAAAEVLMQRKYPPSTGSRSCEGSWPTPHPLWETLQEYRV